MLKQRILTALILIPIVVLAIFKLPASAFTLVSVLFFMAAGWEWAALAGLSSRSAKICYCLSIPLFVFLISLLSLLRYPFLGAGLTSGAALGWLIAFFLLVYYQKTEKNLLTSSALLSLIGIVILVTAVLCLNSLRYIPPAPYMLLFLFALIWGADIAAYFTGRMLGRHKLAPRISPNKTWEGVIGALVWAVICGGGYGFIWHADKMNMLYFIILAMVTVNISIIGDLFESLLKRAKGIKDSGSIFPGHGGILDRIDSLLAALPVFTIIHSYYPDIINHLQNI